MIGLVIVSHSKKLAEATRELAQEMTPGQVPIAIAGGTGDPEHPIGTDPTAIVAAIESVYSERGVIVLMDMGSALLSAETALEFIPPEMRKHIYLCEGPLVEGALAAAVQAGAGSAIDLVLTEVRGVLNGKHAHFRSAASPEFHNGEYLTIRPSAQTLRIRVPNKLGLHARPAARIVSLANQYASTLYIEKETQLVNARSINQLATLGARQGDELVFYADGPDASLVISAIQTLTDDNLGDYDDGEPVKASGRSSEAIPDGVIAGISASKGIAIGPVYCLDTPDTAVEQFMVDDTDAEQALLTAAIEQAIKELRALIIRTKRNLGAAEAEIFQAHILILQDPELMNAVQEKIRQTECNAGYVWWETIQDVSARYSSLDDQYLRSRASDVLDTGRRVLRKLLQQSIGTLSLSVPSILVAQDLSPSDTSQLNPEQVLGILLENGGPTSHSAIFARALGIPAIVGLGGAIQQLHTGQTISMDGDRGWLWPDPSNRTLKALRKQQQVWQVTQQQLKSRSHEPAVTRDGHRIGILANIGKPADAYIAVEAGAEGVGLFRTEMLFMDRDTPPTEDDQFEAYRNAARPFGQNPLIIRTLDVGGDKPIAYIHIGKEENPFLGYRGIRYWLNAPEIAQPQLRAICRASADCHLKVMFPMISTLSELLQARTLLNDVQDELQAQHILYDPHMEVGMMIEVPAAVLIADQLAEYVDFFSIGTNDLTQYMVAADRGNPHVSNLISPFQPAVLRAIEQVVRAAHRSDLWVGVCGEMAGQLQAVPLLIGLGIDELSMSATAIPEVKNLVRQLTFEQAQTLVSTIFSLDSVQAIEEYLKQSGVVESNTA